MDDLESLNSLDSDTRSQFQEREQRLRQYFIETGLQGWGDTTHPPNERQLLNKIYCTIQEIIDIWNKIWIARLWIEDVQLDVQLLRQTQQPIEDRGYIRYIVIAYVNYLTQVKFIHDIHQELVDTIQKLGPYLSDPQGEPMERLHTIKDILKSLEIIEEILQPIRNFSELRKANPAIDTEFYVATQCPWDKLSKEPSHRFQRKLKKYSKTSIYVIGILLVSMLIM